jgi:hypothetical protein
MIRSCFKIPQPVRYRVINQLEMLIYSRVNCAFSQIYALSRAHLRNFKTTSKLYCDGAKNQALDAHGDIDTGIKGGMAPMEPTRVNNAAKVRIYLFQAITVYASIILGARRIADRFVFAGTHCGRRTFLRRGAFRQPRLPGRPPGTLLDGCFFPPYFRRRIGVVLIGCSGLVACASGDRVY